MYLSKEDNEHVFSTLPKHFKDVYIIFDAFSPLVVKISKHIHTLKRTNASFKFGFKNPKVIENISPAIKHVKTLSYNKNKYIYELSSFYRFKNSIKSLFIDKSRRIEIFHIN